MCVELFHNATVVIPIPGQMGKEMMHLAFITVPTCEVTTDDAPLLSLIKDQTAPAWPPSIPPALRFQKPLRPPCGLPAFPALLPPSLPPPAATGLASASRRRRRQSCVGGTTREPLVRVVAVAVAALTVPRGGGICVSGIRR